MFFTRSYARRYAVAVTAVACALLFQCADKKPSAEKEPEPTKPAPREPTPISELTDNERLPRMLAALENLPDWRRSGTPQYARGDDLYDLINGGADIYLEYGFKKAVLANFTDSNERSVIVEIYEMTSSDAAYGIYSFKTDKEAKVLEIGGEAKLSGYYLNLWKSSYVITLAGADPKADISASLLKAARRLSETIDSDGVKPELINRLTAAFAAAEKPLELKYLKGNLALSAQQFRSSGLFSIKEGAAADFGDIKAFVFKYDDPDGARDQFDKAVRRLKVDENIEVLENDKNRFSYEDKDDNYSIFLLTQSYVNAFQTSAALRSSERFVAIQNSLSSIR